jgi:hypothetical protein
MLGVLEAREQAKLELEIANHSGLDAHDIELRIQNLSGKQLRVKEQTLKVSKLESGSVRKIAVDVSGGGVLVDESLAVGLVLDCKELPEPFHMKVDLNALPIQRNTRAKPADVIAH